MVNVITTYHPEYAVFSDLFKYNGVIYPAYADVDNGYIYYLNGEGRVYRYSISINSASNWDGYSITTESPTGYTEDIFSGDYVLEEYLH